MTDYEMVEHGEEDLVVGRLNHRKMIYLSRVMDVLVNSELYNKETEADIVHETIAPQRCSAKDTYDHTLVEECNKLYK